MLSTCNHVCPRQRLVGGTTAIDGWYQPRVTFYFLVHALSQCLSITSSSRMSEHQASSFKLQVSSAFSSFVIPPIFPHDYDKLGIKYLTGGPLHNLMGGSTIGSIGYQESIGCLGKGDEIGKKGKGKRVERATLASCEPTCLTSVAFPGAVLVCQATEFSTEIPKFSRSPPNPKHNLQLLIIITSSFPLPLPHRTLVSFVSLSSIDNSRSLPGALPPIQH